jgi:hypothetical protein
LPVEGPGNLDEGAPLSRTVNGLDFDGQRKDLPVRFRGYNLARSRNYNRRQTDRARTTEVAYDARAVQESERDAREGVEEAGFRVIQGKAASLP